MKFILAVFVCVAVLCGQISGLWPWVKINRRPVCFGARGNQFGPFIYRGPARNVSGFLLVHRSGWVSCAGRGRNPKHRTNWGCTKYDSQLSVVLTNCFNKKMAPKPPYASWHHKAWYRIRGYTASSKFLVFPVSNGDPSVKHPTEVLIKNTFGFRLWYAEDLEGHTEIDNAGKACADVYMYVR